MIDVRKHCWRKLMKFLYMLHVSLVWCLDPSTRIKKKKNLKNVSFHFIAFKEAAMTDVQHHVQNKPPSPHQTLAARNIHIPLCVALPWRHAVVARDFPGFRISGKTKSCNVYTPHGKIISGALHDLLGEVKLNAQAERWEVDGHVWKKHPQLEQTKRE